MVSQDNSEEKNTTSPKLESQTNLQILVNMLSLLFISPSTLNELSSVERISNKNMDAHLGFLLNLGLIKQNRQEIKCCFLLDSTGINALKTFRPLEKKSQIEFEYEEKKRAISELVKRN